MSLCYSSVPYCSVGSCLLINIEIYVWHSLIGRRAALDSWIMSTHSRSDLFMTFPFLSGWWCNMTSFSFHVSNTFIAMNYLRDGVTPNSQDVLSKWIPALWIIQYHAILNMLSQDDKDLLSVVLHLQLL